MLDKNKLWQLKNKCFLFCLSEQYFHWSIIIHWKIGKEHKLDAVKESQSKIGKSFPVRIESVIMPNKKSIHQMSQTKSEKKIVENFYQRLWQQQNAEER